MNNAASDRSHHRWFSTGRAALALVPAALLAWHRIDSSDVWFHLATGARIVADRALPAHDPFGAVPPQSAWILHDWLGAVLLYLVHTVAGAPGLVACTTAALLAALGLPLWRAWRAGSSTLAFEWMAIAATLLAYERFFVRPEIFTLLFVAIFVHFLRGPVRIRTLAWLVPIQIVWTNAHAAFLLGPTVAALAFAAALWDRLRGTDRSLRPLALAAALPFLLVAACCVTPYGPGILRHILGAWRDVGTPALRAGIVEWQPTFSTPVGGDIVLMLFVASLAGTAVAAVIRRRSICVYDVLVVLAFSALACTSRRHLTLFAVAVPPLAAGWFTARPEAAPADRQAGRSVLHGAMRFVLGAGALFAAGFLAFDIARGSFYRRFGPPRQLGWGVSTLDHPVGAAEFVASRSLAGPIFNNIAAGSYLIWRFQGRLPVFVDGRLLDANHFARYRSMLDNPASFDAYAADHGLRLVVLALQPYPPVRLVRHLESSGGWRLCYLDGEGAVLVREDVAASRDDLPRLDLGAPLAPPTSSARGRFAWRVCEPGESATRGRMLLQLGYPAAARADLMRALLTCSDRWDLGLDLASALIAVGATQEAQPLVARALRADPNHPVAWVNAGHVARAAGDLETARQAWERALRLDPTDRYTAQLLATLERSGPAPQEREPRR